MGSSSRWVLGFLVGIPTTLNHLETRTALATQNQALTELCNALEQRQQQMKHLWVKFRISGSRTLAFSKAMNPKASSGASWDFNGEFAQKGEKNRTVAFGKDSRYSNGNRNFSMVYNGRVQIQDVNASKEYTVTRQFKPVRASDNPLSLSLEEWITENLLDWRSGKLQIPKITHSFTDDAVHGPLQLLTLVTANERRTNCWSIPAAGHPIVRVEYFMNNQLQWRTQVNEFITINGVTYPNRGWKHSFLPGNSTPQEIDEFEVSSFETDPSRIPDSLFEMEIPKGATIWDEDQNVFIRDFELAQSHLDEVVRLVGDRRYLWRRWGMIGGGVVGAVVLLGLVYYWRRRKGTSVQSNPK